MNNDRCETCRFFVGVDGLTYAPCQPMCRRLPEGLLKEPNDWCGEYKPATPPDTQVVVTSFGAGSWIKRSPANFSNWQNGTPDQQDVAQKVAKAIDPSQFTPPVEPDGCLLAINPNAPSQDMTHRNREYGGEG